LSAGVNNFHLRVRHPAFHRSIILAVALLLSSIAFVSAGDAWPAVQFTEVRAYAWPDDHSTYAVVLPGMKLKPGAINPGGTLLSAEQVGRLAKATFIVPERPLPTVGCHIPHNAFVFYDARKKAVAYVEVCFMCESHEQNPKPKRGFVTFSLPALATLFDELKLPMGMFPNLDAYKKRYDKKPPEAPPAQ
jgi:hypothetical protein